MTTEIEAYANRVVAGEILRRGRILADKAIRQEMQGEIAWRVLWIGVLAFACALVVEVALVLPLTHASQRHLETSFKHYFSKKHVYSVPPALGADLSSPVRNVYRQSIREKLERVGDPDAWPRKLSGLDGAAAIALVINPDGSLDRARIYSSSGSSVLDARACEIAFAAAPFAPFPKGMENMQKLRIANYLAFNYGQTPVENLLADLTPTARECFSPVQ